MYSFYKKVPVQAFQWQGEKVEGHRIYTDVDNGRPWLEIKVNEDNPNQASNEWDFISAEIGDWIVLEPNGEKTIYHDGDFQKVYSPVEGEIS